MSSLKKNLRYQSAYQILNLGIPLITAPFLSRVLGAESLGIISYTNSIAQIFVMFAMLGVTNYGARSIAIVKNNKKKRDNAFIEIFSMQFITSILASLLYVIYMLFICKDNNAISWIQGVSILACFIDINWFFFGIEEFRITVVRAAIIRILSVVLMFLLIRGPSDLWIYAMLLVGGTFISQSVLWLYAPRYIKIRQIKWEAVKKHFAPNIKLFIPLLAMSIYHIMDKTMLGLFSTYAESGYYYNADKIINVPAGLMSGVITVFLPRMSSLAKEKKTQESVSLFNNTLKSMGMLSAAMCCGIAAIAYEFVPLFFGDGYNQCIILIILLAPVLLIKGFSLTSRYLYLIPNNMENTFTASVIAGAIVNLIVNIALIPMLGALGAVIGTLMAEIIACIWQYRSLRGHVKYMRSIISGIIYFIIGVVMFLGVRCIANAVNFPILPKIITEIITGIALFILLCLVYWKITGNMNEYKMIKAIIKK